MNSEDSLAVLQHVLPALDQGHEPHFHTAKSVGNIGLEWLPQVSQGSSIALEKKRQLPRPKGKQNNAKHPPLSPFHQASTGHSYVNLTNGFSPFGAQTAQEDGEHSPDWYATSGAATDGRAAEGEAASITALEAIQSVATQLGSSLALWGTYISEFVADVAGDNELTDEETAALEKHRQLAKEASKINIQSVTGDLAQPLTRRHSRSSSGRLSRGASLRLDGDWTISPQKSVSTLELHGSGLTISSEDTPKKDS